MNFIEFARLNGVVIEYGQLYASERIRRCGTVKDPRSKNGAFMWNGKSGWVKDWASDYPEVIWYKSENEDHEPIDRAFLVEAKESAKRAAEERERGYMRAAADAQNMLSRAKLMGHPYLVHKGFPNAQGLVLDNKLLIPMRNVESGNLQGVQQIYEVTEDGKKTFEKRMQYGMRSKDAVLVLGPRTSEEAWLVEGYATGLSLQASLGAIGAQVRIVVCFSANNLLQVSPKIKGNVYVFADNDKSGTGERIAKETGRPWTMPDELGWDVNDLHINKGPFAVFKKVHDLKKVNLLHACKTVDAQLG